MGVTLSPRAKPTYRVGPRSGFKNDSLIETPDLHVTDDCLIDGDCEIKGTFFGTLWSAGADVTTNHFTAPLVTDAGSHIVAAAGATNFDYSLATGTFLTSTGKNTLSGDVDLASGKDIVALGGDTKVDFSAGSGIFKTPGGAVTIGPGAISVSGDITVAAHKDIIMGANGVFTSGTGTTTIAGILNVSDDLTMAANKDIGMSGSGTVTTGTGNVTINGNTTHSGATTLTTGTGLTTVGGILSAKTVKHGLTTKSADYTVTDTDGFDYILVDASGGTATIKLPTASDNTGRVITVKVSVEPGANDVIIDGEDAEVIDGAATWTNSTIYSMLSVISNGTAWFKVAAIGTWT